MAYDSYLSSGSDLLLKKELNITEGNYWRINPAIEYVYFRISQKEPFDILYFTPSITGISNIADRSFSPRIRLCRFSGHCMDTLPVIRHFYGRK